MKKLVLIAVVIIAIAVAMVVYVHATTPKTSAGVRLPLSPAQRELLASVPESADAFALIPAAAVVHQKLLANPITRAPLLAYAEEHPLPRAWMMGDSDLVVWRTGKATSYAFHLDPFRAALLHIYVMFAPNLNARVSGGTFLINAGTGEPPGPADLDRVFSFANGLGPADAIVVQRSESRGSFPPIARPAVTAVNIGAEDIILTSVAPALSSVAPATSPASVAGVGGATQGAATATRARFPSSALIAAVFRHPPRVIGELDRLFITRLSHLLDDGGSIVIYDINPGTLLPRPDGLLIANATPENRDTVNHIEDVVKTFGDVRESGNQILLSFDKESMPRYEAETFVEAQWPSNDWSARVDPKRVIPILDKLGDNTGLRIAAPRLYRSSRDLGRWMEYLSSAASVEVSHSFDGPLEQLRVRIASK